MAGFNFGNLTDALNETEGTGVSIVGNAKNLGDEADGKLIISFTQKKKKEKKSEKLMNILNFRPPS